MTNLSLDVRLSSRGSVWKWWVCGLLLLATMINYVDRLTVNLMSEEIKGAFSLNDRDYGYLESGFGSAFALGAIIMGFLADRVNVRLLYPLAVIGWSLAGFATGLAQGFTSLLLCRFMLGLAEAGNWPCALRTTQRILPPEERTLGNSILQSGAAIGAVITPLIVLSLLSLTGSWRYPFLVVGTLGMFWAFLWLGSIHKEDLEISPGNASASLIQILGVLVLLLSVDVAVHLLCAPGPGQRAAGHSAWIPLGVKVLTTGLGIACVFLWLERATRNEGERRPGDPPPVPRSQFIRRFWVLIALTVTINLNWHFFRTWLPPFLRNQHGYSRNDVGWFSMLYYLSSDSGSLLVGFAVLGLTRWGLRVHTSRVLVFAICALTCCLSLAAAVLPTGPLLLGVLLLIAFAALGVFPVYYSLTQELTARHQGKLVGATGCICWMSMALMQELAGESVMVTGSYSLGMSLAGLCPMVGLIALVLLWGQNPKPVPLPEIGEAYPGTNGAVSRVVSEAVRAAPSEVRE